MAKRVTVFDLRGLLTAIEMAKFSVENERKGNETILIRDFSTVHFPIEAGVPHLQIPNNE